MLVPLHQFSKLAPVALAGTLLGWPAFAGPKFTETSRTGIDVADAEHRLGLPNQTGVRSGRWLETLATTPSWVTESHQLNAFYGYSVTTAGDIDGDGYSDVLVGAINFQNGEYEEGRAFLFMGGPAGLAITPSWTAEGDQTIARFAQSVAAAGDVNGDGFADVIVGAPQWDDGQPDEGRAFLFLGSAQGLAAAPAWTAEIDQVDAYFGTSVAGAGDVDGDGYDDVVVGAMGYDNGQTNEGRAYLYRGVPGGLTNAPAWRVESHTSGAFFGRSVAGAGDVNADGYADIVIGARSFAGGQAGEGRAYLHLGSPAGLDTTAAWSPEGNRVGAEFGSSVAAAGDVNGDGYADVIVGARGYGNGQSSEGQALVYLGSPSGLSDSAAWAVESDDPGGQLGSSVSTAGDVNGDGYADVIVGAPLFGVTTSRGRAYVYLGGPAGLATTPLWTVESEQDDASLGFAVGAAGDVDGDGFGDVVVGAPLHDNGESNEGRAFAYLGSAAGPVTAASWSAESDQAFGYMGYAVASAGDVNGDGFGDLISSAIYYDGGQADEGRAFVHLGTAAGPSPIPAWTAEGDQASAHFGNSVASAGDVNGDGFGDVIVGAHQHDHGEDEEGRAYLYLGSAAGLATTPAWIGEGNQAFDRYGISVASAGDVNGDGFGDVIVGAVYWQDGQFEEGRALVYHGSAAGLSPTPAWDYESDQPLAFFGYSVGSAGDVNGDGFSDVIVGAYGHDNGQTNEGRAYVFLGSAGGLASTPAWTAESNQANAYLGFCVTGAGDVNGDGYSDVAASALLHDGAQSDEGRVFVYAGSAAGLTVAPVFTADGGQASGSFGISVASAGDVNADGYSDLVIGASAFDGGQADEGRVVLYFGSASGLMAPAAWTAESNQAFASFGLAAAAAGDVNGDGFGDVVVGAPYMNHDLNDEGRMFVFHGNTAGLDRRARQLQADGVAPIAPLGASESGGFRLWTPGRSPAGRTRARMEWQVEPLGEAFAGMPSRGDAIDTGAPAPGVGSMAPLSELISDLELSRPYHWRVRVASGSPFFPHSPWWSPSGNGAAETDLRTGPVPTSAPEPAPGLAGLRVVALRPNPARARVAIDYSLATSGEARLTVHDLQGRRIRTLLEGGPQAAGAHTAAWDGRDASGATVAAGIYWVRLQHGGEARHAKLVRW